MTDIKTSAAGTAGLAVDEPASAGRPRKAFELRKGVEVAALVVLLLVFSALDRNSFPTLVNLRTILDQASVPLIVGAGATFVILMGSIDLSVEGIMGASGMTFVLLSANSRHTVDLGLWAIPIGIGVGATIGLATGLIHTRLKVPSFVVTLGMWFVGLGIATLLFGDSQIPFLPDGGIKEWPTHRPLGVPNSFALAAVIVVCATLLGRYTRLGRSAYAIGENELIAGDNGVRVNRHKTLVFTLAGGCSGLAGILATLDLGAGSATVGIGTLFLTIAAVVIGGTSLSGGRGGVLRTVVGVLMLTVLNNGLIHAGVSPNLQSAVSGGILVLAVVAAAWPHRSRLRIVK